MINAKPELEALKVGDKVVVTEYGYAGSLELYIATVIHRTSTRIQIQHGKAQPVFTTDGDQFPRPRGYGNGRSCNIDVLTPENIVEVKRSRSIRSIKSNLFMVDKFVSNRPDWSKFSQEQLDELNKALYNFGIIFKTTEETDEDSED
jgi:hypothetical protein